MSRIGDIGRSCVVVFFVLFFAVPMKVHANDVEITLSTPDRFVNRNFTLVKKGGERVAGLVTIEAFDRTAGHLVFNDVRGVLMLVPVGEIQSIAFRQDPRSQNPTVQAPLEQVTYERKGMKVLTVADAAFVIDNGKLHLKDLPSPGQNEQWEMRNLTYDSARKKFSVEIELIKYIVIPGEPGASTYGSPGKSIQ